MSPEAIVAVAVTKTPELITPDVTDPEARNTVPDNTFGTVPLIVAIGIETNNPELAINPEIVAIGTETNNPELAIAPEIDAIGTETNNPEFATTPLKDAEGTVALTPDAG